MMGVRSCWDLRNKPNGMSLDVVDRLTLELGKTHELHDKLGPPDGKNGWGPAAGRFCGDYPAAFDGCGTFHHPHHAAGLCEDCHLIWKGEKDGPTRDIRMALAS